MNFTSQTLADAIIGSSATSRAQATSIAIAAERAFLAQGEASGKTFEQLRAERLGLESPKPLARFWAVFTPSLSTLLGHVRARSPEEAWEEWLERSGSCEEVTLLDPETVRWVRECDGAPWLPAADKTFAEMGREERRLRREALRDAPVEAQLLASLAGGAR